MPPVVRRDPPVAGGELPLLTSYLDYHRDTLRLKVAGLDAAQLRATHPPSDLTLGGMLKHLAFVEHWWLACMFRGDEYAEPWASVNWRSDADWDWDSAAQDDPDEVSRLFEREVAVSDAIIAAASGPEARSVRTDRATGEAFNLRWILVHLIEEYARHNGHADLIRESIDGVTGE